MGGTSTTDNVTYTHLLNIRRIALPNKRRGSRSATTVSVFEKIKWRVNRASLLGDSGPSAGKPSCHEIDGIVVAGTELDDE